MNKLLKLSIKILRSKETDYSGLHLTNNIVMYVETQHINPSIVLIEKVLINLKHNLINYIKSSNQRNIEHVPLLLLHVTKRSDTRIITDLMVKEIDKIKNVFTVTSRKVDHMLIPHVRENQKIYQCMKSPIKVVIHLTIINAIIIKMLITMRKIIIKTHKKPLDKTSPQKKSLINLIEYFMFWIKSEMMLQSLKIK